MEKDSYNSYKTIIPNFICSIEYMLGDIINYSRNSTKYIRIIMAVVRDDH